MHYEEIKELLVFPSWVGSRDFDLGMDSVGQRGWEEGQVQKQSWHQGMFGHRKRNFWWPALRIGREDSRRGCWVSRWGTVKGLVRWAKFGFYPVENKGKTLKDFKHRVILVKCVFPGWWPADGDAGGETQWPKAGRCRQPGFSANASRWLSAPCGASRHTCKIPKSHTHSTNVKMHTFYDCYIWISINFKVRKLKLENFHILALKCINFIHSFNNMFWGTHFVLGSVWDMQVSCTDRAAFSGTGSSTFDGVLRTVDFYVIQLTTLWTN